MCTKRVQIRPVGSYSFEPEPATITLMPLAKCPRCNRTFHLDSVDPESWYTKRWPTLETAEFLPDLCWSCRKERRHGWRSGREGDADDRKAS